jgi:hypothetical protein
MDNRKFFSRSLQLEGRLKNEVAPQNYLLPEERSTTKIVCFQTLVLKISKIWMPEVNNYKVWRRKFFCEEHWTKKNDSQNLEIKKIVNEESN